MRYGAALISSPAGWNFTRLTPACSVPPTAFPFEGKHSWRVPLGQPLARVDYIERITHLALR